MDPISVTGLAIAVAQVTSACLKSIRKSAGPSQHSSNDLKDIKSDLYSFNAAISNLKLHLQVHEADDSRLLALSDLERPLKRSNEALKLIKSRLEDVTFVRRVQKQVLGVRFDEKLKGCLRVLKMSSTLFVKVLQIDHMNLSSAIEECVHKLDENVTDVQSKLQTLDDRSQHNHQEIKMWQVKAEQQRQDSSKSGSEDHRLTCGPDEKDREILSWLSSLNFVTKQNDVLSRRHEQTGAWFFNSSEFKDWVSGPAKMLWCPGIPGAGKTVLASISVDHLKSVFKDEDVAVLCVFCSYADQGNQKTIDLVASILEQLVRIKGVTDELRVICRQHQMRTTLPGLPELSRILQSVFQGFEKAFIVIDALDECPETSRESFLGEIYKLRNLAHLLITSRHSSSVAHLFLIHCISKYTPQTRILNFVGNAKGMFLLVQLHLETLAKKKNKRDLRKALSSLPNELNETYNQTMERIRSQDTESVLLAERVLSWISAARRPLTVEELQHALAVQPGENSFDEDGVYTEDVLISACAGLVTVDRQSRVIGLVHYTTQNYLERVRSEKSLEAQTEIQVDIAKACIAYLGFDDFESDRFTRGEERIVVSRGLRSEYPFLGYAGKNWGHHARGDAEIYVEDLVHRLLQRNIRLLLICDLIDDTPAGYWNFGPEPTLTILVHFGLERILSDLPSFDDEKPGPTCAIRYRNDTLVFFLVDREAYWHDSRDSIVAECSSQKLEGNENIVRTLVQKGVTMDLGVDNGELLFIWALLDWGGAVERKEMVNLLREHRASIDQPNYHLYTALIRTVVAGNEFDVRRLLDTGVAVNERNEHGRNALIYAALARNEAAVRSLLEAGADVHASDRDGMTALCAACEGGNERIVKQLLRSGADISAQDKFGQTAMSIATGSEDARLLRVLLDQETDDDSEAEVEAGTGNPMFEAQFKAGWDYIEAHGGLNSSDNKFLAVMRRNAIKEGYVERMSALVDAYVREKDRENDPTFVEEPEVIASEPRIIYRRAHRAIRAIEEQADRRDE